MQTCETCQFWERQPDKVYQPTEWQKPVGPPQITRYGVCSKLYIGWMVPNEDMLADNASHCAEPADEITTGINFGCIHHQPKE